MSGIRLSLAVVLLASPSAAMAQRIVVPGDTVQVRLTGGGRALQGVALSATDQSLVVRQVNGADQQIAAELTRSIRILDGRTNGAGKGAGRGLVIGALVGGAFGLLAVATSSDGDFLPYGAGIIPVAIGKLGLVGGFLGFVIGSTTQINRWVPALLPATPGQALGGRPAARYAPTISMGVESTVLVGLRLRR